MRRAPRRSRAAVATREGERVRDVTGQRAAARIALLVLAFTAPAGLASAQDGADVPALSVPDADPMQLARVAARAGDATILAHLEGDTSGLDSERLTAIRAAPWMHAPEVALGPLLDLASGRDPWLAPAAMRAALTIAQRLTAEGLVRREADGEALVALAARCDALADRDDVRADLRAAASFVAARLRAL